MPTAVHDALAQALELHRAGRLADAEQRYRQLLASAPRVADGWHLLGVCCLQSGRPAEAVDHILQAIALDRSQADYYNHLGAAYGELGRHDEAVASLRHAVRLAPQAAAVHYNLGTALRNAHQWEAAVASFRHSIAADGRSPETHYNLANTLRELKRFDEAEASYRQALALRPRYGKALINLGNVLTDQARHDEAIAVLREAVALNPDYAKAHLNLGTALRDARRFDEAVAALETAVALDPRLAEAHNNLGTALQARAQFDEAWACYRRALELNPEFPEAHFSNGTFLLREGDLARGFAEYAWRWKCPSFSNRRFAQPAWDGTPLAGRTLLLHAEQGLGDTLQFIRYAADAQRSGGKVLVECQPAAMQILAGVSGIDLLIAAGAPLPEFDVHLPLLSLPGVLGLTMEQLARGAYLQAEPARIAAWRERLGQIAGFRVGICWQGNPKHLFDPQRSFPLAALAPVGRAAGVRLVSLQKGYGREQLAGCSFEVVDLADELDAGAAFLDTAAVIKNLDLVISSDTAVAHLAGGLGAPAWVALSRHSDWRWFAERGDCPWYPSMRLFRQTRLDVWDDVFERIAAELARLAGSARSG